MLIRHACFVALALASLLPLQGRVKQSELRKVGRELAELYRTDQEDQNNWDEANEAAIAKRTRTRVDRAREIVAGGLLGEPIDYHHAAWLLQHGERADDFLMAHLLATAASFEQFEQAYFMSAAALDRFAMNVGQAQRFGSQTFDEAGQDLGDTSALLPESTVALFSGGASGLQGKPAGSEARSKRQLKTASKFLAKGAKRAPKLSASDTPEDRAAWQALLDETTAFVAAGSLKDGKDYYNAGLILSYATNQEALLLAHIMATGAGLLERKHARELYARTLDHYLLALGRSPIFDAELAGDRELDALPAILTLHPRVRERLLEGD